MALSPDELAQMYPQWDADRVSQMSQMSGYQQPPPAAVPQDLGLPPEQPQPDLRMASNDPNAVPPAPAPEVARQPESFVRGDAKAGPMILDPGQVPAAATQAPTAPPVDESTDMTQGKSNGSSSSVTSSGVSEPVRRMAAADINKQFDARGEAVNLQEQATTARDDINIAKAKDRQAGEVDLAGQQAEFESQARDRVNLARQKFDTTQQEVGDGKIDPNRVAKNMSTLAKITFAIASGLSAYGSGINKTQNVLPDMMRNAINADVEAQKAEYESGAKKLSAAGQEFQDAVKAYGSIPAAVEARRAALQAYVARKYDVAEAQASSQEHKADIAMKKADWYKEHQNTVVDFAKKTSDNITKSVSSSQTQSVRESHGVDSSKLQDLTNKRVEAYSKRLEDAEIPKNVSLMKKASTMIDAFDKGDAAGIGFFKRFAPNVLYTEQGMENRQLIAAIHNAYIKKNAGGNVTAGEASRMSEFLNGDYSPKSMKYGLGVLRDQLKQEEQNINKGFGKDVVLQYRKNGQDAEALGSEFDAPTKVNKP